MTCGFNPRDSMLARYICCRRLSVCLSVTRRHCIKTAKCRISKTTLHDSPGTLVLRRKRSLRNSDGIIPNGGAKCRWGRSKYFLPVEKPPSQTPYSRKFVSIHHGGPRPRRCAGGGIRGVVINNFGGSRSLMITVTVQLTSTRLVV